jgi:hypothetical protein
VLLTFQDQKPVSVVWEVVCDGELSRRETIHKFDDQGPTAPFEFRLQTLGSGLTALVHKDGLPQVAGQIDRLNQYLDLRRKEAIRSYQTRLLTDLSGGSEVTVRQARAVIDTGVGLADMRAITCRDGRPYLDRGRVWYTMSIRGRQLPHHLQGVFSMDPSVFDLKLEGIILFDRGDGLLRNEIASHIFFDQDAGQWRGVTTGFTAFADPDEQKELWAVRSRKDPRFGITVMDAAPMDLVGDYEDAHVLYDADAGKWRMLVSENHGGYKAVVRESAVGTATTSGSAARSTSTRRARRSRRSATGATVCSAAPLGSCSSTAILTCSRWDNSQMDLPPWSETSGTRVWANLIPLPEGYLSRYVLLTMDRFNYPGISGRNWSYGALYLYHGCRPDGDRHRWEYDVSPEETRLLGVLKSQAPLAEKSAACRELARVGTAKSVLVLSELLEAPQLSHMARDPLEGIPGGASEAALRSALRTVKGPLLVGVISSVMARGERWAWPDLMSLLRDPDP